jgi:hypothetical protein
MKLRSYWAYSVGLLVAWVAVIAVARLTGHCGRNMLLVFGGFVIAWVSGTIARYVYPPPARWTR